MEFSRELLFFFSALGAFNGLVLALYFLFYAKPRTLAHQFLGALLLVLSIRVGKSVFFFFKPDLAFIYLQIGLSACVLIGPFLYFYMKASIDPESQIGKTWKYHFVAWVLLILVVGIGWPFENYVDLWRDYFIQLIYLQWLGYIILSSMLVRDVAKQFWQRREDTWLMSIYLGNIIIWFGYNYCGYNSYILGALSFSFMLYLLILLLLTNTRQTIKANAWPKYGDKKIEEEEAATLLQHLDQLMGEQELYKDPNLKLPDVAKQLNILPHRLSQLLNDNLGKNFSLYINEYRIEAAKVYLKNKQEFSLEAIGYDCGFNSKSTFYATFKKHTGTTPAKFRSKLS